MATAGSVYPALTSRETAEIRKDLGEWLKGFKDVPCEDSNQSLHFVPWRRLRQKTEALYQGTEIHPEFIRKYEDNIQRLKADIRQLVQHLPQGWLLQAPFITFLCWYCLLWISDHFPLPRLAGATEETYQTRPFKLFCKHCQFRLRN